MDLDVGQQVPEERSKRWVGVWLCLWACALTTFCLGQEGAGEEIWFDIGKYYPVGKDTALGGDTGVRGFFFEEGSRVLFVRPSLRYRPTGNLSLYGGLGLFYAFREGPFDANEIRPWGGISLRWPTFRTVHIENYFRAEGRFLGSEQIDEVLSVLRLRHKLGTVLPLGNKQPGGVGFYLPVSFEVLFAAGGDIPARFINQTRLAVGLGYQINPCWRIELNYNNVRLRTDAGDDLATAIHLFRIQIKG